MKITLAVDLESLPTEFRLFTRGWNSTENGKFLFDYAAAKSVMAAYAKWGIDLPIDLEHQMLEVEGGSPDPAARDARGWCKLELRNGELWACDVKWTPDGAQRLTNKTQRYISPAFESDPKTRRVLKMINIAITALPATHKTPALVAARRKTQMLEKARKLVKLAAEMGLDPSLVQKALDAIEKGDAKAALEILKGLVASAAGAEPSDDGSDDGSEGDGAEGVAPPAESTESVEDPKVVDNAAPPPAKGDDGSDDDDEDDDAPAKKANRKVLRAALRRMTGKPTFAEAVAEVEVFRASHLALETERQKLARERATLESAERRKLCVELVRLGAEFPATVWADDKQAALKPRWLKMPITELRSHVADQKAARGDKTPAPIKPLSGAPEVVTLSAAELQICKEQGCDPKDFAALKAQRDGKKGN